MLNTVSRLKLRLAAHFEWRLHELRQEVWRHQLSQCGEQVAFNPGVVIFAPERVSIGDHSSVAANTVIWGDGGVAIGSFVLISANCSIVSTTHPTNLEERATGRLETAPVTIEDHVWIGAGAVILPGVTLGRGAIVGAGAVVTHDVTPGTTVAGVPARTIRNAE